MTEDRDAELMPVAAHTTERVVTEETCERLKELGGTWYAYRNDVLDSEYAGHVQCLKVGADCTHKTPPEHMPDSAFGLGWKWRLLGLIDPATGSVSS